MTCLLTLWATDTLLVFIKPFTNVSWCLKRVSKGFELTTSAHLRNAQSYSGYTDESRFELQIRWHLPGVWTHNIVHTWQVIFPSELSWVSQSFLDYDLQLQVRSDQKRTLELTTLSRQDKSSFPLSYEGYTELHGFDLLPLPKWYLKRSRGSNSQLCAHMGSPLTLWTARAKRTYLSFNWIVSFMSGDI